MMDMVIPAKCQQVPTLFRKNHVRLAGATAIRKSITDVDDATAIGFCTSNVIAFAIATVSTGEFRIGKFRANLILVDKNQMIRMNL